MKHIKDFANAEVDRVLIYAGDSGCYWRQNACGYTYAKEAGVFTRAEAYALAGHCGPEKLIELHDVPEDHIPTLLSQIDMIREYNDALRKERDTLRAKVDRLTDLFMQVEGIQPDGELGISATKVQQWYDDSQNLMTLRAEVAELKAKWKREECAHCDERPGGHLGTIWCAECFNWHCSEAAKERMQSELDAAMAEAARLRAAMKAIHKGACLTAQESRSRDDDRYCLADVIQVANEALSSTPTTAEWLAARDAEQRRIGAAEALEDIAKEKGIDGGMAYFASVVYREFPDRLTMSIGVVEAADLMFRAARLRAGKGE